MDDCDAQQSHSDAGVIPRLEAPSGAAGNSATNSPNAANSSSTAASSISQEKAHSGPSASSQASSNQPVLAKKPAAAAAACVTGSTKNKKEPPKPPQASLVQVSVKLAPGTVDNSNKDSGLPVTKAKPKPNPQPKTLSLPPRKTNQQQQKQPQQQQQQPQYPQQQHYVPIQPPVFYSNGVPYVMQPLPVHHTAHMMHPPPPPVVPGVPGVPVPPLPPHIAPYPLFHHHPFAQQHAQQMQAYHQSLQPHAIEKDKPQRTEPVKHNSIPQAQAQAQAQQEENSKAASQEETGSSSINNKTTTKRLKLQLVAPEEKDTMFQPLARFQDDTYYLHDDEILVEEDPLPPPSRYAHPAFAKPTSLPSAASLRIHPVPMRTVGGIQDQVHATPASCSCKNKKSTRRSKTGDACLILYCDCFATGSYCNQNCRCEASCYNNASEANVKPRTQAIVDTLRADPQAFRKIHYTAAEQQKEHRSRLAKMMESRRPIIAGSESDPLTNKPPKEVLTLQLPPSYYTAPLKIHNDSTILTGLSFSLTHPRSRKRRTAGGTGGVGKKHLYHNLMLSPSKNLHKETPTTADPSGTGAGNAVETQRTGPTELEVFWQDQTKRLDVVFDFVRREITSPASSKKEAAPPSSTSHNLYSESKKVAETFVPQLKDDVEGLKAVAAAAKGDILARFFQESRLKRVGAGSLGVACRYGTADDDTVKRLACNEELPPLLVCSQESMEGSNGNNSSPTQQEATLRELTIFAAQDTAILQETARIIRKTARELCERRVQRKETTTTS